MVKLVSVRPTRLYGPRDNEAAFEFLNALTYMVATALLLAGFILLLPGFNHRAGLIVLSIALILIILVNLHDLYAQLAGIDFRLGLLADDVQLALVEMGAPLANIIGGILFLIAVITTIKIETPGLGRRQLAALHLLIAGAAFWLLGSLHNACQVYERMDARMQVYQNAVYLPLVIASTLYLISSVLWMKSWPHFVAARKAQYAAATLAIIGCVLLVIGSVANINRIVYMRRLAAQATSPAAQTRDKLRGASGEEHLRQPFLGEHGTTAAAAAAAAATAQPGTATSIEPEEGHPAYKEVVLR